MRQDVTDAPSLRVSVASVVRVLFDDPRDRRTMIALERTATVHEVGGRSRVTVLSKPFGGGVRITDPAALRDAIGAFDYDSHRSRRERDFRLQIHPSAWERVKDLCLGHLAGGQGGILDTSPHRELAEEFGDALNVVMKGDEYRLGPRGLLVENVPAKTHNVRASGRPTVRIYFVFEAWLEAPEIIASLWESSDRISDRELRTRARRQAEQGGRGRANGALVLGLEELTAFYLALPSDRRGGPRPLGGHRLAGNVPAVLDGIDPRRYRVYR